MLDRRRMKWDVDLQVWAAHKSGFLDAKAKVAEYTREAYF